MFPIRDFNSFKVQLGERVVCPKGFYLLEKGVDIGGKLEFWRGCKIFKVFSGDLESRIEVDGSDVYEFVGHNWLDAKKELENFFDQWMKKWFTVSRDESEVDNGWKVQVSQENLGRERRAYQGI